MVNANDFAINIAMVINIAIHKTFSIYNLVNKLLLRQHFQYNVLIFIQACTDNKNNFIKMIKSKNARIYSYL